MRNGVIAFLVVASALACATAGKGGGAAATGESAGEQLYRSHCGACHRLRDPAEQTRERWAWAVDRFGPRAHLSPDERTLVLGYLQAHAKDAVPSGAAPASR